MQKEVTQLHSSCEICTSHSVGKPIKPYLIPILVAGWAVQPSGSVYDNDSCSSKGSVFPPTSYCRTFGRKHHWFTWIPSKFLSNWDTTFYLNWSRLKFHRNSTMTLLWKSVASTWETQFMFIHQQGRWGLLCLQLQFCVLMWIHIKYWSSMILE